MKIIEDFLTPNKYSRPQHELKNVYGLVIHYVANPMSSAKANRDFFESRKDGSKNFGSTHYIIGLDGEVIRCVPETEVCYHVGAKKYIPGIKYMLGKNPNFTTIGIECCHIDWTGKMTDETYQSLVELTGYLTQKYNLMEIDLYLHYNITGKDCHRWFVKNKDEWNKFKHLSVR
jgi:N-acetylmuramoyl-L-alanine amidase